MYWLFLSTIRRSFCAASWRWRIGDAVAQERPRNSRKSGLHHYFVELLRQIDNELQKKRSHLSKNKVFFHHNNGRRPYWTDWATNCCPIHNNLQIWPRATFSKLKKLICRTETKLHLSQIRKLSPQRRKAFHTSRKCIFRRVKKSGASLGKVYRAERKPCWEIHCYFCKIFIFIL